MYQPVTFYEIGVSLNDLRGWRNYFGPDSQLVGIDSNQDRAEHCHQIRIRIGRQEDEIFLGTVVNECGPPDCVLDDGGHNQDAILRTFNFLYPKLPKNGVYMIEDLHDYKDHCKFMDRLMPLLKWDTTRSFHCYDSMVVIERSNGPTRRNY